MNNFISFDDALEQIKAQGEQERKTIEIAEAIANNDVADAIEKLQREVKHLNRLLDGALKEMESAQAENERLKKKLDAAVADIYILIGKYPSIKCFDVCNGECLDCYSSATKTLRGFKWRGED